MEGRFEKLDVGGRGPAQLFTPMSSIEGSFFLDSSLPGGRLGRYSFFGGKPSKKFVSKGEEVTLNEEPIGDSPFEAFQRLLSEHRLLPHERFPFLAGGVGFFSYDLKNILYPDSADETRDDLSIPDIYFSFHDHVFIFEHKTGELFLYSAPWGDESGRKTMLELISQETEFGWFSTSPNLKSNFSKEEYIGAIEKVRDYIRKGDIYQANISHRLQTKFKGDPYGLYHRLRNLNPASFSVFLNCGDFHVLSSSPERFLRRIGDQIETRPIKGTRPRGRGEKEDELLKSELTDSQKDHAEHLMIVDLERNDLGRVCEFGSVKVSEYAALESYATVHHLVSTVEGRLRRDISETDILKATFPGGSITGAPKVRSMEIIEELEPTKRGVYTGSIGYVGFDGRIDLNIAIRTMVVKEGSAYFQVGGGIVIDSDPESEYQETWDKGEALAESLRCKEI
ncbi:MAG: aminodeoxychorismate synthase component I [Candidatus Altiarchaeota archaeon]